MQERRISRDGLPVAAGSLDVVRPLPRRKLVYSLDSITVALPRARHVHFEAGILSTILRLGVWLRSALQFVFGNSFDVITRRDSEERRAVRLRRIFEDA